MKSQEGIGEQRWTVGQMRGDSHKTLDLELGCNWAVGFRMLYLLLFAPHEYLYLRAATDRPGGDA